MVKFHLIIIILLIRGEGGGGRGEGGGGREMRGGDRLIETDRQHVNL